MSVWMGLCLPVSTAIISSDRAFFGEPIVFLEFNATGAGEKGGGGPKEFSPGLRLKETVQKKSNSNVTSREEEGAWFFVCYSCVDTCCGPLQSC